MASQAGCPAAVGLAPPQPLPQRLSEAVLETITNASATSTRANYQQRWRLFSLWCNDRGLDPKTCPVGVVLHFLQYLLDTRRAASTLRVYAAAISAFHDLVGGLRETPYGVTIFKRCKPSTSKQVFEGPILGPSIVIEVFDHSPIRAVGAS